MPRRLSLNCSILSCAEKGLGHGHTDALEELASARLVLAEIPRKPTIEELELSQVLLGQTQC